MSYTIPTTEPTRIVAGDTVQWTKSLPDYLPTDGWTLTYAFTLSGDQHTETAADNGDGTHLVTLSGTDTTALTAGIYSWQAYVTSGTERHTVGQGRMEVLPNLAASGYSTTGYDNRSHVKKVLDAIEAVIEGRASSDQISMSVSSGQVSRSLSRMSFAELIEVRNTYRFLYAREIRRERIERGLPAGRKTQARF